MRLLSKEGVAVIPGDRMDATGEEWVGETGVKNDLCLAGSGPSEDGDRTIANIY